MKKVYFILLFILCSAVVVFRVQQLQACIDADWDESQEAFTPEVSALDSSFFPLFYSNRLLYINHESTVDLFYDEIVDDWTSYLHGLIPRAAVRRYLLNDSAATELHNIDSVLADTSIKQHYESIDLKPQRVRKFFAFLHQAKRLEKISTQMRDSWDYNPADNKILFTDSLLLAEARKAYDNESDAFVKNRLWLQLIKAAFYSPEKRLAEDLFDSTSQTQPRNTVYYRAMSYAAGACYRYDDYTKSNLLFARVFAHCPTLRFVAGYQFHPQSDDVFMQSLLELDSSDDKLAMWTLYGYYGDGFTALKHMVAINNNNAYNDLLLVRCVNQRESASTYDCKSFSAYRERMKKNYDNDFLKFVDSVAAQNRNKTWVLASAYLNALACKADAAEQAFTRYRSMGTMNALEANNYKTLHLCCSILNASNSVTEFESTRAEELRNAMTQGNARFMRDRFPRFPSEWFCAMLNLYFREHNEGVYAQIFAPQNSYFESASNRQQYRALFELKQKTSFEQFCCDFASTKLSDLEEYEAMLDFYQEKLSSALAHLKKSDAKDAKVMGDPFDNHIQDNHDSDHVSYKGSPRTKAQIIERAIEEKKNLKDGAKKYNAAMTLGHIAYNTSYFGNARLFYEGNIMGYMDEYRIEYEIRENVKKKKSIPPILSVAAARKYYETALASARNDEERARALFLIAKCERDQYYMSASYNDGINFLPWKSYAYLKSRYSKTTFYKQAIAECGYLRSYAQKH